MSKMEYQKTRSYIDTVVSELCATIDDLKDERDQWRERYESLLAESIRETNERLEESKKGIVNALMFTMAITDDKDGNLVINSEARKELAQKWQR